MTPHDQLTELLKPVLEHIEKHNMHHIIIIGKDGTCTRSTGGKASELEAMLEPIVDRDPILREVLERTFNTTE